MQHAGLQHYLQRKLSITSRPNIGQTDSLCVCANMQQSADGPAEVTLLIVPLPMQVALPWLATTLCRNARPSSSLAVELACVLLKTDANLDMSLTLMCKLERLRSEIRFCAATMSATWELT